MSFVKGIKIIYSKIEKNSILDRFKIKLNDSINNL